MIQVFIDAMGAEGALSTICYLQSVKPAVDREDVIQQLEQEGGLQAANAPRVGQVPGSLSIHPWVL